MKKRFLRVLMAVTMGVSLSGCAAMQSGEWCGRGQVVKETPPPPPVERPYTPPPPAPKPAPPKPDRN